MKDLGKFLRDLGKLYIRLNHGDDDDLRDILREQGYEIVFDSKYPDGFAVVHVHVKKEAQEAKA